MRTDFKVAQAKENKITEYKKGLPEESKEIRFVGVQDDGVVIKLSINAPKDIFNQRFQNFIFQGFETILTIETTTTTITQKISNNLAKKDKEKKTKVSTKEIDSLINGLDNLDPNLVDAKPIIAEKPAEVTDPKPEAEVSPKVE